jgi:hypothetical protein
MVKQLDPDIACESVKPEDCGEGGSRFRFYILAKLIYIETRERVLVTVRQERHLISSN